MSGAFYLALTPWLTFAVADRSAGLKPDDAALISALVSVAICANQLRLRQRPTLSLYAAFVFAAFTTVTVATGHPRYLERADRAIMFAALALWLLGSLLRQPTTLTYATEGSARRRSTESFRRHHTRLTFQWSLAVAAISLSFAAGAIFHGPMTATVCNWFIPIALVAVVVSRTRGHSPSAQEESISILGVLDSFLSHPSAGLSRSDAAQVRPSLHLLPEPSVHTPPHQRATGPQP